MQVEALPRTVERVRSDLPPALDRLTVRCAPNEAWCCWRDGPGFWFYFARLTLSKLRMGGAVLYVVHYDSEGHEIHSGSWSPAEMWRPLT